MSKELKSNRLSGDVALVTGAASGLDRGIALELAINGAVVACADINDVANLETVEMIKAVGGNAFPVHMNIGDSISVKNAVKEVYDKTGKITILINGAAVSRFTQLPECTDEEWDFVMNINLNGVFRCIREVYPYMKETGGKIVNISSTSGKSGGNWAGAHYVAAKAAVIGLSRYCANQFCQDHIRVNTICPGVADTPLTATDQADPEKFKAMLSKIPMGRKCTPDDIAGATMFLVSDESKYVTGISIDVTGGRYIYNN